MPRVVVDIGADTAQYVEQVKRIPGITEKEVAKAAGAYRNTLIKDALKGLGQVEDAAKDAVEGTAKATEKLGGQLLDIGELAGVPGDKLKKLGSGLGALASPAGIAAIAIGSVAAATIGAAAGIVSAVAAADDLARELEEIKGLSAVEGFGVGADDLRALNEANAAMQALSTIGKQAVVALGAEFAPAVEAVSVELVKFGLIALDTFNRFAEGGDVLRDVAEFFAGRLVKAILAPVSSLVLLADVLGKVAKAAGADGLAADLEAVDQAYEGFVDTVASGAVDALGAGFERLSGTTSDYDDRARQLVSTLMRHAEATRNASANAKALAEAEREAERIEKERQKTLEGLTAEYQRVREAQDDAARGGVAKVEREIAALDDLRGRLEAEGLLTVEAEETISARKTQLAVAYTQTVIAEAKRLDAERQKLHEQELARIEAERAARVNAAFSATSQTIALAQQGADLSYQIRTDRAKAIEEQLSNTEAYLTDNQRAELDERLAAEKKAAKRSFALSKALAIVEIAVSTAQASMAAFAQGMKVGGPVAAGIFTGLALGAGALQTAVVARQKPPAHRGLVPMAGGQADEGVTVLTAGEAVLSPRGVENAGGAAGVAAMNRGQPAGGGATTVNLQLGLKTLDTITAQAVGRPGATRAAMRRRDPVGQRSSYRGN